MQHHWSRALKKKLAGLVTMLSAQYQFVKPRWITICIYISNTCTFYWSNNGIKLVKMHRNDTNAQWHCVWTYTILNAWPKTLMYILPPWRSYFVHIIITQILGAFEIKSQLPLTIHINGQNNSQKCFSNVIITG